MGARKEKKEGRKGKIKMAPYSYTLAIFDHCKGKKKEREKGKKGGRRGGRKRWA